MKVASHDCILAPFQRNQIKATSTAPMSSIATTARLGWSSSLTPRFGRDLWYADGPRQPAPTLAHIRRGATRHSLSSARIRKNSQLRLASGVQVWPACVVNISIVPSGAILTPQTRSPPAMTARVARDTSVYRKAAAGLIDSSSCGLQTGGFGGS